jgi:hypothetical protein
LWRSRWNVDWQGKQTKVLGENIPQRHFCPSQNPTWSDPGLNPGRRGGKPATTRLSYGAAHVKGLLSVRRICRFKIVKLKKPVPPKKERKKERTKERMKERRAMAV